MQIFIIINLNYNHPIIIQMINNTHSYNKCYKVTVRNKVRIPEQSHTGSKRPSWDLKQEKAREDTEDW